MIDMGAESNEHIIMFPFTPCSMPGCLAFTAEGSDRCYHHSAPEIRERIIHDAISRLEDEGRLSDLSLVNAEISGIRTEKGFRINGCSFSFTVFEDCAFTGGTIVASFFDYCIFRRCTFSSMDIRYSVFAGSSFTDSVIEDSTVIHSNLMGIDALSSDFSGNDFYFSNFSLSRLVDTDLEDCNLKRTNFRGSITRNVSLRYSNPEEAFFRKEENRWL